MNGNLICPECSSYLILRNSKYGKFYGCSRFPLCKATHGAHPDGKPLGIPANKELKSLRIMAHKELEKHFGEWDKMTKKDKAKMYSWLKNNTRTGHVGSMDIKDICDLMKALEDLKKEVVK